MKIISKFKDYYDYNSGIYGVDPLVIYNRNPYYFDFNKNQVFGFAPRFDNKQYNNHSLLHQFSEIEYRIFYICGLTYGIIRYKDKYYYSFEEHYKIINDEIINKNFYYIPYKFLNIVWGYENNWFYRKTYKKNFIPKPNPNSFNQKHNCPIIISTHLNTETGYFYFNQKLSDYNFGKILSAKDIYLQITDFCSKKDQDIPSDPNDMYRYEEKGFDKKTSFRKM